jgi:hypothetical protein
MRRATMPEPPIQRPDGSLYHPRKLVAEPVLDDDEITEGVVVFGTHDPDRAYPLPLALAGRDVDTGWVPVGPELVWWRDGFEGGRRAWIHDERHSRAGVWFREIVERTP